MTLMENSSWPYLHRARAPKRMEGDEN